MLIERRGIDGATAIALILLAKATVEQMPAVLDALRRFLTRNAIDKIEITEHGIRVERPRPADVDKLLGFVDPTASRFDGDLGGS